MKVKIVLKLYVRTRVHDWLHGIWVHVTQRTDKRHVLDHALDAGFTESVSTRGLHWFMEGGQTDGTEVLPIKIRTERSIVVPRVLRGSSHLKQTRNLPSIGELQRQQGHHFGLGGGLNSMPMHSVPFFKRQLSLSIFKTFAFLIYHNSQFTET